MNANQREKTIVRTSVIGILANALLAAFKAFVGIVTGSIAVTLDAVNNLSDALSSVITILGTKLAGKRPDRKHPLGYGRVEYLTAAVISVIVLYAGVTSLVESVKKIVRPEAPDYTTASLIIIAAAVVVKIVLGRYVKGVGERVQSDALVASGTDATLDSVISAATLVAAGIFLIFGLSLEAWLGAVISLVIIKSGLEMLRDAISTILGERADSELTEEIKAAVTARPEVHGAYDLTLHNYGPTNIIGSVHVELDDDTPAREIHRLTRQISMEIYQRFGVVLTIGVYARGSANPVHAAMRKQLEEAVARHPEILQMHGFYVDDETRRVMFDLIIDFSADAKAVCAAVVEELQPLWPDHRIDVVLDSDFSD